MGPFIMNPEGVGRLFVPIGALTDGPFPEHYEPIESPIKNPLHPEQSNNPLVKKLTTPSDKFGTPEQGYSIVCTTYRLTEQYHYWTKNNPMNVQLIPEPFVEIPVELADEKGIRGTEKIKVISTRGTVHRESLRHAAAEADDDRREKGLSNRVADSPGFPRNHRRRRKRRAHAGEFADADGHRSECLHP